jgi:hypothetical protein
MKALILTLILLPLTTSLLSQTKGIYFKKPQTTTIKYYYSNGLFWRKGVSKTAKKFKIVEYDSLKKIVCVTKIK